MTVKADVLQPEHFHTEVIFGCETSRNEQINKTGTPSLAHPITKYSPFLKFPILLIEVTKKAYLTSFLTTVS